MRLLADFVHTGVIAAAALKCMGGHFQGRLYPRNEDERTRALAANYDLESILHTDDLASGEQVRASFEDCLSRHGWCRSLHSWCAPHTWSLPIDDGKLMELDWAAWCCARVF